MTEPRALARLRRLGAVLWLAATPLAATAQPLTLASPSIGEALRRMDRMHEARSRAGLAAEPALPQVFVLPQRPGQNQVSWYDFDWQYADIPSPSGGKGGVRLYFYRRERAVAELALPIIRSAYLRLVDQFHYTPTKQIPYILYSSKREFQATNVFEVTESVLGVTSPRDLKMSLPYFGDHQLFREVSTHELVHQFTIQKMLDLAGDDSSGLDALPLWFIEGIAEYYTKGGLDPDSDLYLRDVVWNPDPERRYEVVSFAEDRYRGYIPTYKLGQARVTFIAEVYGKERIQGFLENAPTVGPAQAGERTFAALTQRVLNEPVAQVDARWRAWLKRRYYPEYVAVRQDLSQLREVHDLPAEPEAFAMGPDGNVALVRGIDRDHGRVKLYLADLRHPRGAVEVAADNRPGVESLHPIEHSVMAVHDGVFAFSAQSGAGDVLYVQEYRSRPPAPGRPPSLAVGDRRRVRLEHPAGQRFMEIWDPAFSPDGTQLAFVGITDTGQQDIYAVPVAGGAVRQLTHDSYSEHDLAWGADGLYFTSDATDHGRLNLFRLDDAGARHRLTTGAWDDHRPAPLQDGSVLFASDEGGKTDLRLLRDGAVRRVTDFATTLTSPAVAPGARGIWASTFYRGRFRIVEVPRAAWLEEAPVRVPPAAGPALPIPREELPPHTTPYEPFSASNWRPEAGAIYGGGAAGFGIAGSAAILFADMLRDRLLYLDLSVLGSFDYTQALALYEDRSARTAWVLGAYHFVLGQIVLDNPRQSFLQRDFGVLGTLRFPLDRFRRVEAELSLGGVQRYCLTDFESVSFLTCGAPVDPEQASAFERANGGVNPQVVPTFRYGYDTVRFDLRAGPISGDSLLLEVGGGWLPWRKAVYGFARADAMRYWQISGRMKLLLRLALGTSFAPNETGRVWARTWWLSAGDNLRGYSPFDLAYLTGRNYYVANAELQVPLDPLIRFALFDGILGVAALDFGGVFNRLSSTGGCDTSSTDVACVPNLGLWDTRTLTGVLGVNFLFGPLLLRVHFGHPFDIGGVRTPALQRGSSWVTNITLRYFFY